MFREHAKLFNRLQFVADVLITLAAFPVAYWSRIHLSSILPVDLDQLLNPVLLPYREYFWIVLLATVCWSAAAYSLGLYRISIRRSGWEKMTPDQILALNLDTGVPRVYEMDANLNVLSMKELR